MTMILFAPAKINIGLKVLNKRPDNYHNLDSIFYPVPLYDLLEVVRAEAFSLKTSGIPIDVPVEQNLLYKVWQLMRERYDIGALKIHLHKRIPMGAGLGGGSSDASHLIKAISQLYGLHLSVVEMEKLALQIGADCPFFIRNVPLRAQGIGNEMSRIDLDLSGRYLLMVKPDIHISTVEAYSGVRKEGADAQLFQDEIPPREQWKSLFVNSFEHHLFEKYPVLADIKTKLYEMGAFYASMSGSGATVYGLFDSEQQTPEEWTGHFIWQGKL